MKIKQLGENIFQVASERDARRHYKVEIDEYSEWAGRCSCLAYRFNRGIPCKHIIAVRTAYYGLR